MPEPTRALRTREAAALLGLSARQFQSRAAG